MECDRLNACQYSCRNGAPILETMELVLFKHEFWVKQNPTIISPHLVHLGFPPAWIVLENQTPDVVAADDDLGAG